MNRFQNNRATTKFKYKQTQSRQKVGKLLLGGETLYQTRGQTRHYTHLPPQSHPWCDPSITFKTITTVSIRVFDLHFAGTGTRVTLAALNHYKELKLDVSSYNYIQSPPLGNFAGRRTRRGDFIWGALRNVLKFSFKVNHPRNHN